MYARTVQAYEACMIVCIHIYTHARESIRVQRPHPGCMYIYIWFFVKSGRQHFRMFKSGWHFKSGRYILTKSIFGN